MNEKRNVARINGALGSSYFSVGNELVMDDEHFFLPPPKPQALNEPCTTMDFSFDL